VRTGVARLLGDWLIARARSSEVLLLVLLMVVVCALGSMMSSTAVTAIFIPVALRIAQSTGASPSRLMMALSFAALISGMTTPVATAPNLVVNSELVRHGAKGFHFFSFTPFGVPILVLGIAYMIFARRWLAAAPGGPTAGAPRRPSLADWVEEYKLAGHEQRVRVTDHSALAGKTLEEVRLGVTSTARLVAIERDRTLIQPTAKTELRPATSCSSTCWRRVPTSRPCGTNTPWRQCRSPAPTSRTCRRRLAWRRSSSRRTRNSSARPWPKPGSATGTA
jgi:hypothetical protein